MQVAALHDFNVSANDFFDSVGKRPTRVSAVTKNADSMGQGRLTEADHFRGSGFVGDIGRCDVDGVRQTCRINA